jgi:cytochrome c oxidase subunit II
MGPARPWGASGARLAAATLLTSTLSGCDAVQRGFPVTMFRPASPQATFIYNLTITIAIIAAIAFVIVEGWLFIAAFRFRNRPEERAVQTHGNLRLEIGWTVVTAVVIFAVLGLTVKTMVDVTAMPAAAAVPSGAFPGEVVNLRVTAHQWWWEFEYPTENVVTGNEVHVPVGRTVRAQVESADVIHSLWIPQLNGKTDAIPGHTNFTSFLAASPGVYHGICAEYCGGQHAHMGFRIIADPVPDFANWVRGQQAPAAQPTTDQQRAGERFVATVCAACHTVRSTPAQAKIGPDLTHFGSRQTLAADFLDNTPQNVATWLHDPQAVKPDNKMPNLNLDQAAIDQLVAYLENLK